MVYLGYDSDDEGQMLEPESQKYFLRKPVSPFVCSTPCDFDTERSYLAEKVFPKLRDLCISRGTGFTPTDIQWEPDSQQTDSGHLLRVCLDYISKCSPYFICLLGETYGPHRPPDLGCLPDDISLLPENGSWLDKNYLVAASAGYQWIRKEVHQNCSVVELEIIQAAFLGDSRHAHFYYRQPEHLDHKFPDLSVKERKKEAVLYKPESEYADLNIRDLKQRIVNKGLPVKYFRTNEELGNHVLVDWMEIINTLYPPLLQAPAHYDMEEYREWLHHEVFLDSRRQVYLNHTELRTLTQQMTAFCSAVLDEPWGLEPEEFSQRYRSYSISSVLRRPVEMVVKTKSVLVLRGDRGVGKSTLISNWVKPFCIEHPEVKVICHFVGSSGRSRDISTFMRRCVMELRQEYLTDDYDCVNDEVLRSVCFKELCASFQAALSLGPCVLLLDGADELGTSLNITPQEVKGFSWLPLPLPHQCRVILTTSASDLSHSCLTKRPDVQFLCLSNVNTTKLKAEFLEDHMSMHFDHLNRLSLQTVFECKLSGRPLFLQLLGREMCSYSVYSDLEMYTETIREMCTSIRDLYVRSFKRWCHDYSWSYEVFSTDTATEKAKPDFIGWVPDLLRLLAVSRSGLTINEILQLLENMGYQENVKVTQFDWLMFRACLGNNVTENPYGLFNFAHQHMREIVEYVLLGTVKPSAAEVISPADMDKSWKKQKTEFHQHLVEFFQKQSHCQRRTEELPWQLLLAGDLKTLEATLTEPEMFLSMYDEEGKNGSNYYDLRMYWSHLSQAGHSPQKAYSRLLEKLQVISPEPEPLELPDQEDIGSVSDMDTCTDIRSDTGSTQITLFTPSTPNVPHIYATPAVGKLSVIEEASSDILSKDERSSKEELAASREELAASQESVFITQNQTPGDSASELSPAEVTSLAWFISQFLIQLDHKQTAERILLSLSVRLAENFPLSEQDQLTLARVQDCLGVLCLEHNALELAESWFKKALRSVMDMFDIEESSALYGQVQVLKGQVIEQIGCLRLQEGLLDDADDLLQEALETTEVTRKLQARARVLANIGILRMRQCDYLMSETNLRKASLLTQKWYGKSHPLVADILFTLGTLMSDDNNDHGYDRMSAENAFRQCLDIREHHLEKDHLLISHVLFELGKLLRGETSYAGKAERQRLLRRALDIRITHLGGDHIETRAVRQYLNNLEATLKSAKHDARSSERPYSSLSWRGNDLANLERKYQIQSGRSSACAQSSRPGSVLSKTGSHMSHSRTISRPVSGQVEFSMTSPSSQRGSFGYLPASERLMLETQKPRLLHRESVDRKLKQKEMNAAPVSQQASPKAKVDEQKQQGDVETAPVTGSKDTAETNNGVLLDSFATENNTPGIKSKSSPKSSHAKSEGRVTPSDRLYQRYGSPQGVETTVSRSNQDLGNLRVGELSFGRSLESKNETPPKHRRPTGSARSVGSSQHTMASATSLGSSRSMKSHRTSCDIPAGPHSIHISNARTTTIGPHSSLRSLLGNTGPKDISKGIHHKAAWYHVPGRYSIVEKKVPPKRSQQRKEAKELKKYIPPTGPDPYSTFMKSDYRKNNPNNVNRGIVGTGGHTCSKGQTYAPYPRSDKKQYILCESCRHETREQTDVQQAEINGMVEEIQDGVMLSPTVNGLTVPDRPKQVSYMLDEPMNMEDIDGTYPHAGTMVTFQDAVVMH